MNLGLFSFFDHQLDSHELNWQLIHLIVLNQGNSTLLHLNEIGKDLIVLLGEKASA